MNRRHPVIWLFVCLALLWGSQEAFGYAYLSKARWKFGAMPIPWYVTYSKSANWHGRSKEQLEKMARKAFGIWEDIDCSYIMFRYMGTTPTGSHKGDGLNTIDWVAKLPTTNPRAIGLGGPLSRGSGEIYEGNVWIKAMQKSDDFISIVIAHEVGHAMALGHTDVKSSIMFPSSSSGTKLTDDDKQGLCNAYPISSNSCGEDSHCPKGLICKDTKCVKCKSNSDCGGDRYCDKELCVPKCKSDGDCEPKGRLCDAKTGVCGSCEKDEDCGDGRFCDNDKLCQDKCKTDDDCGNSEDCRDNGRCIRKGGCVGNTDCKTGEFCQANQCVSKGTAGKVCKGAGECDENQDCVPHDCKVDLDCNEGFTCKVEDGTGTCVDSSGGAASVCGLLCKGKGAIDSCPNGFLCKEFTADKHYCFAETRKPEPPPGKDPNKPSEGCGCSTSPDSPPDLGGALFLGLWALWLVALRRRRRQDLLHT